MSLQKPVKYLPFRGGLATQANYEDMIQKHEEVVGMTKEDFEENKMLFSSEFLLGLEYGSTSPTDECIVYKASEKEPTFRPPPVKRRIDQVLRESLGKKETFCLPPKRVLFVMKPEPVSDTIDANSTTTTTDAVTSAQVKPANVEKKIVEITNFAKQSPGTYAEYLRLAELEPKKSIESANIQNQERTILSRVKVPWHLLSYYRSLGLCGIYFYVDTENSVNLSTPKLEPCDVDPEWYLKSSEFIVYEPAKLGNEHVHDEHIINVLSIYSSRRGISSKDRTYYKRHGPAGPRKPFKDAGRDRKQHNKYPSKYYRGHLANYLEARAKQESPTKIYKL